MIAQLVCGTLMLVGVLVGQASTAAATTPPVALSITELTPDGFSAGGVVSLRFTATNNTRTTRTFPAGNGIMIIVAHYFTEDSVGSMTGGCYVNGWGEWDPYALDGWYAPLPTTMAPGQSISCTLTYRTTSRDVANKGIWVRLNTVSPSGSQPTDGWQVDTVAAKGLAGDPRIAGTAAIGHSVTVAPAYWAQWDKSFSYRWLRDGVPIKGATAKSYKLVAADLGRRISVTVVGRASDGSTVTKVTAAMAKVAAGSLVAPVPTISGTPRVGRTLTAKPGAWAPPGVKLTYQWLRNGVAIRQATGSQYKVVAADRGKHLSVKVTGTLAGYNTLAKTSTRTISVS